MTSERPLFPEIDRLRGLTPEGFPMKITRTAICGSDLHPYDGFIPTVDNTGLFVE